MNVEELLDLMEETLEAGTAVPFAPAKRVVDVDRMRDIIDEVRNNLPDEIRESKTDSWTYTGICKRTGWYFYRSDC